MLIGWKRNCVIGARVGFDAEVSMSSNSSVAAFRCRVSSHMHPEHICHDLAHIIGLHIIPFARSGQHLLAWHIFGVDSLFFGYLYCLG
jgi:hypothetical protein